MRFRASCGNSFRKDKGHTFPALELVQTRMAEVNEKAELPDSLFFLDSEAAKIEAAMGKLTGKRPPMSSVSREPRHTLESERETNIFRSSGGLEVYAAAILLNWRERTHREQDFTVEAHRGSGEVVL